MFSNRVDTYTPIKDDKLKTQSNSNFDFEGEGFSSMLEEDETLSGKLRETDAELIEDESILSTDEENRAIAKQRQKEAAESEKQQQKPQTPKDEREMLKLMDISTKTNIAIKISKSKRELETTNVIQSGEELSDLITVMSTKESPKNEIDLASTEKDSKHSNEHKEDTLHETEEELLEDLSILSTDEENLAMVNKAREYKQLEDKDFSDDIELISELKSIQNQSQIEVNSSQKIKNAENIMAQVIQESKQKTLKLSAADLSEDDIDYIINVLQNGGEMNDEDYPSTLSLKFLSALKDAIKNKKVFRIDFDNEISVIIRINVDGKVSANFLTPNKEIEEHLKNNLYLLRQRFEQEGIKYENIEIGEESNV